MLHRVDELLGFTIHAADGDIGRVHDLYFDDQRWTIRYLVVDTRHCSRAGASYCRRFPCEKSTGHGARSSSR